MMQYDLEPLRAVLNFIWARYSPAPLAVLRESLSAVPLCLAEAAAVSILVMAHRW